MQRTSKVRRRRFRGAGRGLTAVSAVAVAAAVALSGCAPLSALLGEAVGGGDARSCERVEVPEPVPHDTVADFGAQSPEWISCPGGMEVADVLAPLDWEDPAGETITLHLVRHRATGGETLGTLFLNPGGPGASGADYVANGVESVLDDELLRKYDVIGWDPRGVEHSSGVRCLDAAGMDDFLFGVPDAEGLEVGSDAWIRAAEEEARGFGEACEAETGALLAHVSTADTVQDLDMLRAIAGDPKLNYLGFSYGTYIGARYADMFPERVGRLVLDGAMDPSTSLADVVREQTRGFELSLRAYVTDCLTREGCPFDGTVDEAMGRIGELLDRVDAKPLTGSDGRSLTSGTLLTAIITPLYSQDNWGYLDQLFQTVSSGDADVALSLADFYYDREGGEYLTNSTEAFSAINCLDYPVDADVPRMREEAAELDEVAPTIGRFQGYGDLSCSEWPVQSENRREPVTAAGADPILVVGTTGDPATPYRWAVSLADQLESGVLVTYEGEGHTAYGGSACVGGVVDEYFLTGKVPAKDPHCS